MVTEKQLVELGLETKQAKVYLSLLELGPSTATEIARKAKINRTTSYEILDVLVGYRLVNTIGETKIRQFAAESPKKVVHYLEDKLKNIEEQLISAKTLLPQLLSIYNLKSKPHVRFYEGLDGMREAFEDTLTAKDELLAYAVGSEIYEVMGEKYCMDYFKRRTSKGILVRVIAPDDIGSRQVIAHDTQELRKSLLVPKNNFYFKVELNIYNNKLLMVSWKERFAIIVESDLIADMQKKVFELAWEGAKKLRVGGTAMV